jgi:pimeloyl-ACP methyl ester carboxylesterase
MNRLETSVLFVPTKVNKQYNYKLDKYQTFLQTNINKQITIKEDYVSGVHIVYAQNPDVQHTIIYAHGNGGNLSNCLPMLYQLLSFSSVVLFDYHGYGKSDEPANGLSEHTLYQDALTVWKYTTNTLGVAPSTIILFGHSLGATVVVWLGQYLVNKGVNPALLVMEAGFSSLKGITADTKYWPLQYFIRNKLDSAQYIKQIGDKIPILILHSPDDEIINIHHKDELLKANPHAVFHEITGTHNNPDMTVYKSLIHNILVRHS